MKPPFPYFGSKVGMAQAIVDLLPAHREIVNDANDAVIAFFRCLRDRPDELELACALTPYARSELAQADYEGVTDDLELARRFWCRVNMGFGAHGRRSTGFSRTMAGGPGNSKPIRRLNAIARFGEVAARLAEVTIECCDAVDLIEKCAKSADTLVYLDPPYLAETRNTGAGGDYVTEMTTLAAHVRMAEALQTTPAMVVLSGYSSPAYEAMYEGWHRREFVRSSHTARDRVDASKLSRVEVLWSNRPFADGAEAA